MSSTNDSYKNIGIALVAGVVVGYLISKIHWHQKKQSEQSVKTYSKRHNVVRGVPIIVAEDVREYRELAKHCLRPTDVVLEVGCALGVTTDTISNYCADAVGIDSSENQIARAKERFPEVQFECFSGDDISRIKKLRPYFNKIFVDISGSRELQTVLPLVNRYEFALKPELIIVKNFKLQKLLNQSYDYTEYPYVVETYLNK